MNDKLQPYKPGGQVGFNGPRRPQAQGRNRGNYQQSGVRCPMCNSGSVQPFSAIYGFGTTNYHTSVRGLFFPQGFRKTKKQSVMAEKCSPPNKMSWGPTVALAFLASICYFSTGFLVNIGDLITGAGYILLLASLGLGLLAGIQNFVIYPKKLDEWGRKIICKQCGTVFETKF